MSRGGTSLTQGRLWAEERRWLRSLKYDFYNPSYDTASKAFVVRLDSKYQFLQSQLRCSNSCRNDAAPYTKSSEALKNPSDLYDVDTPPPLSPIEELDDDLAIPKPRRNSDPGLPTTIEGEKPNPDDSTLAIPEQETVG